MKLTGFNFYIDKDGFPFLKKLLYGASNEVKRNEKERKDSYCKRLCKKFPAVFNGLSNDEIIEVTNYLINSFIPSVLALQVHSHIGGGLGYEQAFDNGELTQLELRLLKLKKNESSLYDMANTLLLGEFISKIVNSKLLDGNDSREKQFYIEFNDFWSHAVKCPYGAGLEINEAKVLSCEDKFAGLFENKGEALYVLGRMYYFGNYVEQDYKKALGCFEQAVEQGCDAAKEFLIWLYFYGEGTEKNYSKACELYREKNPNGSCALEDAFEKNDVEACIKIGDYFRKENDCSKAIEWYNKAAMQGDSKGQFFLGAMYARKKNYEEALKWYRVAAENGFPYAEYCIYYYYLQGQGVEKNFLKAKEGFEKLAEANDESAQYNLGLMYYFGQGVKKNYKKSYEWIKMSASNGYMYAKNFLPFIKKLQIPIMAAAKDNSADDIKHLINSGIDINAKYEQEQTALMFAARFNSSDVARLLIDAGADVNATDVQGRTALDWASIRNSCEVASLLIDAGACVNLSVRFEYRHGVDKKTPLMHAAINNSVDVVKILIEKGADPDVRFYESGDYFNKNPRRWFVSALEFAVRNGSVDVVKLFIDMGLEARKIKDTLWLPEGRRPGESGQMRQKKTKFNALLYSARYNSVAIAELTFDENENMQDVLMEAVREGAVDVVKFLISKGVWCGKLAFNTAVSNNSVTIAKLLSGTESALDEVLQEKNQHWKKSNIQFEFHPKDEYVFKRLFVLVGVAHRYLYLKNTEKPIVSIWHLINFNMNSNLKACIFSSTHYRKSLNKGLWKVELKIPGVEKYENYSPEDINREIDEITRHIYKEQRSKIVCQNAFSEDCKEMPKMLLKKECSDNPHDSNENEQKLKTIEDERLCIRKSVILHKKNKSDNVME